MKCEICGKKEANQNVAYKIKSSITLVSVCSECASDIEDANHILNTKLELKGDIK